MLEIRERYPGLAQHAAARDRLLLPFERRQKSRQRAQLASGDEVAIDLPRGQVLRGGDLLLASDDRVVLDYDGRHRRRTLLRAESGAELLLDLHSAMQLRDGDGLACEPAQSLPMAQRYFLF